MAYTTVDNPELYFQTKLYTGNGGTQSITLDGSENMQPDWVFFKQRTGTPSSSGSQVYDVVRGATKYLSTHATNAEATQSNGLTSFDSDGFSIGNTTRINGNTESYVAWNWKAGGSASSNTDGSITSSVSANQDAGFSIVSYTGTGANATVGHGLSSVPYMMIIKKRNSATGSNWMVYHKSISGTGDGHLWLDLTNGRSDDVNSWNNTAPTSSVFSIGTRSENNGSGDTFIAYCFAPKSGFSSMGQYTGNGNADGTFIYLGFKPAFMMVKRTDNTSSWPITDGTRDTFNAVDNYLSANNSNAESDFDHADFLSNGIKFRTTNDGWNVSGGTYIYMAFASNPFVTSTGVPATAR